MPSHDDIAQLRKDAYKALEDAITKCNAMMNAIDEDGVEMMAVDAVLVIGSQWIDRDGDRCGAVNIIPRHGWQPGYITAGMLAMAQQRVLD